MSIHVYVIAQYLDGRPSVNVSWVMVSTEKLQNILEEVSANHYAEKVIGCVTKPPEAMFICRFLEITLNVLFVILSALLLFPLLNQLY